MKPLSFVLIVTLLTAVPAFAQDANHVQIPQAVKIQLSKTEPQVRPSYALPPQGQANTSTSKQSSGTSHKKRNIIIAVVAAAAVGGVIVAAHNGVYGSSGSGY